MGDEIVSLIVIFLFIIIATIVGIMPG
ncbi:MAG: hypothetical protein K0R55_3817, partial [Sporomusa sp.]|nr:hypothetical protein [Sporomusa sp.]